MAGLSLLFLGDVFINKVFYVTDIDGYASSGDTTKEISIDTEEGIAQIASPYFNCPYCNLVFTKQRMLTTQFNTACDETSRVSPARSLDNDTVRYFVIVLPAFHSFIIVLK